MDFKVTDYSTVPMLTKKRKKKAGVALLISDNVGFKVKTLGRLPDQRINATGR